MATACSEADCSAVRGSPGCACPSPLSAFEPHLRPRPPAHSSPKSFSFLSAWAPNFPPSRLLSAPSLSLETQRKG